MNQSLVYRFAAGTKWETLPCGEYIRMVVITGNIATSLYQLQRLFCLLRTSTLLFHLCIYFSFSLKGLSLPVKIWDLKCSPYSHCLWSSQSKLQFLFLKLRVSRPIHWHSVCRLAYCGCDCRSVFPWTVSYLESGTGFYISRDRWGASQVGVSQKHSLNDQCKSNISAL